MKIPITDVYVMIPQSSTMVPSPYTVEKLNCTRDCKE